LISEWYYFEIHSFFLLNQRYKDLESYFIVSYRFFISVQPSCPCLGLLSYVHENYTSTAKLNVKGPNCNPP